MWISYRWKILPSYQRIIEQAKFTYSPFGKAFEKKIKIIEDRRIKQVRALKALKSDETKQEIKINRWNFFQKRWELMKLKVK